MPTAPRSAPRRASRRCCSTPGKKPRRSTEPMARRTARASQSDASTWLPAYRWMLIARRIDETMWTLRRQGKGHFVVSSAGHEAIGAAVGVAFANRSLGTHAVVWIGFGDGGAQKGEVHEAMNFASIHRLAVVFCIENNLYTQSVPLRLESSVTDLSTRAAGYGMPGVSVDGMDLLTVAGAATAAVDRARSGDGPS